jgi:hypothetical protein
MTRTRCAASIIRKPNAPSPRQPAPAGVVVFDHTIRRRVADGIDRSPGTPRQPVTSVHNDYTAKSGPQRVRDLMGEEAGELLRHRFEIVNVWRPIRGPLRDTPLAVCDATSVDFADFVPSDLVYRDRIGETYRVLYNPAHRWFYVPEMRADEAVLIKCYDSVEDGTARFTAHSAFEDPTAPPRRAAAREHRGEDPRLPPRLSRTNGAGRVLMVRAHGDG